MAFLSLIRQIVLHHEVREAALVGCPTDKDQGVLLDHAQRLIFHGKQRCCFGGGQRQIRANTHDQKYSRLGDPIAMVPAQAHRISSF